MKILKKILSIAAGIGLISSTICGAAALDLSAWPSPVVTDGVYSGNTFLVIGANAAASDTLGAVDIANQLQFVSKYTIGTEEQVTNELIETQTTSEFKTGETEEINLGAAVNSQIDTLTDSKLLNFQDSAVNYQGENYDYHEEFVLGQNVKIETSLTSSDSEYEDDIYLEAQSRNIIYNFAFDDTLNWTVLTGSEDFRINVLGHKLRITSVGSGQFTAYVGNEYSLDVGDVVTVDGKKVLLKNVGSGNSVVVNVDGMDETIPAHATETVNGIEIHNDETFYADAISERMATLIIGKDAQKTYKDGEEFIGEDSEDPDWVWDLDNLNAAKPIISVVNDFSYTSYDTDRSAENNPIKSDGCYTMPEDYVQLCMGEQTVDSYQKYQIRYEENIDLGTYTKPGIVLKSSADDDAFVVNAEQTDKVAFVADTVNNLVSVYYEDENDYIFWKDVLADETANFDLNYEDTLLDASFDYNLKSVTLQGLDVNDALKISFNSALTNLQSVYWGVNDISTKDYPVRTNYGITIDNIENSLDDEDMTFAVPSDVVKQIVKVNYKGSETTATTTPTGNTTTTTVENKIPLVTPININPVLDTEISDVAGKNIIVVGGPAINTWAAHYIGSADDYRAKYTAGQAIIKLIANGDNVALVVAGYDAADTRRACKKVAEGGMTGTEMVV